MKLRNAIFCIVLLSTLSTPTFAEHMYGSISAGHASEADLAASGQTASGMSYSLLFGFQINENFAYEVAYTSLFSEAGIANTSTKETLRGIEVAGVGSYPLNGQLSIFGRLGYANMDPSYSAGPLVENLVGFVYGLGVQYDIDKKIGIRSGYNIYNLTSPSGDSIVGNAYASVLFRF